ncbi:MAG: peptidoglycan endopeptidase [Candidatus Omnitrophota bacterium]
MRKIFLTAILLCLICFNNGYSARGPEGKVAGYAAAIMPAPVLNTPDFSSVFGGDDGRSLKMDGAGLIREVEFVALPGSVFEVYEIINKKGAKIYRVGTDEYPYDSAKGYFVDSRFVSVTGKKPKPRAKVLPDKKDIIRSLISAEGSRYIWGGNCKNGIPEMLDLYPPRGKISGKEKDIWTLKGVDCSGLLYEADGGNTPRNTGGLISCGKPVRIRGLDPARIAEKVEPLDVIAWNGHVIIALDKARVIESRVDYDKAVPGEQGGVKIRPLRLVLDELMKERAAVDDYNAEAPQGRKRFVIRRWYPGG